ncbi:MAG: RNA polymerase subunit sigma-70, partial [Flavobacterium sp.]|nr:RNA polymerase subunit sigma-70 [Flavobacterium sp.]
QFEEEYKLSVEISDYSLYQMKVEKLEKALLKIPPDDKMILQLKYQDDASIKELEELFQLSESAVKMRLSRAKSKVLEEYNNIVD